MTRRSAARRIPSSAEPRRPERTKCNETPVLDAFTIEMTGCFVGGVRERAEKIIKTQPIV